ncbi:MAG TPA: hypothetical protein VHF01_11655 [Candidatus Acidoferrum sp.]|nr:hypothetical protein [Candidatus Acidoferrum sp.]
MEPTFAGDVTAVATSLPELPSKQVIRENILSTLDDMFHSGIQLLTVEGAEEIGKTTLLAQFAKRHATRTISLFVKPTSWFSYDLQILLRDMCNQMHFILQGRELREDEQTDESYYRQLVFGLARLAARKNADFYFVVDGIEDVPDEAQAKSAIIGLLPVGVPHVKCLIATRPEYIFRYSRGRVQHKSYILSGFALEETFAYFSDLQIDRRFFEELYKISSRGVPGQIASIRRLLEAGTTPESLLNELPEKLPNLFDLEWKTVDQTNEPLLNLLALASQPTPKHSVADLALITRQSPDQARQSLAALAFVRLPKTDQEVAEFVSDRFRRYIEDRLLSRRPLVRQMAIEYFLQNPETDSALALLPTYLEQAEKLEELVAYLSPEHFGTMVNRSGSLLPVRQSATLGVSTAFRLGRDGDLLRFGVQKAALQEFDRFSTLRSEVRAWMSLGEYAEAVSVAQAAILKQDRLRLLATIARFQKENGLTPKPELLEQINLLFDQVTPEELGNGAVRLASDLMYSRPDLGIKLAERLPAVDDEDSVSDWTFARLSVDALVNAQKDKVGIDPVSEAFRRRIKNPLARQFSSAVSFMLGTYSVNDILAEVQKLSTPSEKIFMLRLWALYTDDKENSADVIEHALKLVINTSEYAPTAKDLRELATPLPYITDKPKLEKLISTFDTQRGVLKTQGPTQDYIQLQLTIGQAEAKNDPDAASKRLQEVYLEIRAIKDLEVRTGCTARLMAALPSIDPQSKLQDTSIIAMLVEEEFQKETSELLGSTAEHLKVTQSMIEVLATSLPHRGLALAESLNAEPRRDRAKLDLVESALIQPLESIPFSFLSNVVDKIVDVDLADKAIERILRRAQESNSTSIKTTISDLVSFIDRSCKLSDIVLRRKACGWSAALLARVGEPKYEGLRDKVFQVLRSTWESMDGGVEKIDSAHKLTSLLAREARSEALFYLEKGQELKRDPQLDCGRPVYISTLRLAIRAFSGLFASRFETADDLASIASAIDRIPSLISRVRLWTDVSLRYVKANRTDDARKIVSQYLQPLLSILEKQDYSLWKRALTSSSPALYQAHAASTLELLNRLPRQWRDVSLDLIVEFIFRRVPPSDPFENREDQCNLDWQSAGDICTLLSLMDSDSLIYGHIETLVQSAIWNHNETPLTREQRNELAQRLTNLVADKLPNPRFITHNGFAIISSAQIARLQKHRVPAWENLIGLGRSIPNVCDRLYVLAILAKTLPNDFWPQKVALLNEAHQLTASIPSLLDKLGRLHTLASLAADIDKPLAKKMLNDARDVLLRTNDPETEPIQRRLVDLAYRIDPDAASSLASSLDTDEARRKARERIKYNEFRDSLLNKQPEQPEELGTNFHRLAEVAQALLGQLNANRIPTRHVKTLREWIKLASAESLRKAFPVFSFAIENAICRLSKASDGRVLLRELCDASIASCELVSAIANRHSGPVRSSKAPTLADQSSKIFVHAGERAIALEYLKRWLETSADSFLHICDPWFGVEDLEVLRLILEAAPTVEVTILTSRKKQNDDGLPSDYQKAYREYWQKHFSDQEPPPTELAIVGTQITGELPIHDRWWLTQNAGICMGTSFNGLGSKGGAEISVLTKAEVIDRQNETDEYLKRLKREHLGQKLSFNFVTI